MNALRLKEPVFVEESSSSGRLFWGLVIALVISVFASIVIIGSHHDLLRWM